MEFSRFFDVRVVVSAIVIATVAATAAWGTAASTAADDTATPGPTGLTGPSGPTGPTGVEAEIAATLQAETNEGEPRTKDPEIKPAAKARCASPRSYTMRVTRSSRVYLANYAGAEPSSDKFNRAMACHYATGRRTYLGFSDVIEGYTFGTAKGAGDYLAFGAIQWVAADGGNDLFHAWNVRTGKRISRSWESCVGNDGEDCSVEDLELTARGNIAYVGCTDVCAVVAYNAKRRRRIIDRDAGRAMLIRDRRLYWLHVDGSVRSRSFR